MELTETIIHSFIIKIRIEEIYPEDGRAVWRGHIVHVPSYEGKYFSNLGDISSFISLYLDSEAGKMVRKQPNG